MNNIPLTRTANTLRNSRTEFLKETIIDNRKVTILKLSRRTERQHYIVYFNDDLKDELNDWEDIIVLTEISNTDGKFRICIKPSKQFPELNLNDEEIYNHLKKVLT